jgi:hypothetical protein
VIHAHLGFNIDAIQEQVMDTASQIQEVSENVNLLMLLSKAPIKQLYAQEPMVLEHITEDVLNTNDG